jgi:hypothetical protein
MHEDAFGIIGYRGTDARGSRWWNHMPASQVKAQLEPDVWDSYFKFCVIRNPFDKLVSAFHMNEHRQGGLGVVGRTKIAIKRLLGRASAQEMVSGSGHVERFRSWIHHGGWVADRDKYLIDGAEVMDYYVRYEHLEEDLCEVCKQVGIPHEPDRLPRLKANIRRVGPALSDYYDARTMELAAERYRFEIERFGYAPPGG